MNCALPSRVEPVPTVSHGYPTLYADLERLVAAPDHWFEAGFKSFVQKLEEAFRAEEAWMEEHSLEDLKEHRELHGEVLALMHHAQARIMAGDVALARKVIRLLPTWFNTHIPHVDLALQAKAARHAPPRSEVRAQSNC